MKKNGFTLVEILAVVVIISILMVVAVPASQGIGRKINERLYNSKIQLAGKAAILWGEDNKNCFLSQESSSSLIKEVTCKPGKENVKCFNIKMKTLAAEGYIEYDDKENKIIENPKNKLENLNDYEVTIRYNIVTKNLFSGADNKLQPGDNDSEELETFILTEAILKQGNGESNISSKGSPDFTAISPPVATYKENTNNGGGNCNGCTSNKDKAVGTGYIFHEKTGLFSLTNYQTDLTYTDDHIGLYTCGDNTYENCENAIKIIELTDTGLTSYSYRHSSPHTHDYSDTGLYAMNDDYGTSYYYRGAKSELNNNIIFAGHQWKIIRINGNGSTKLLYNGECLDNVCEINDKGKNTLMGSTQYSINKDDNKYTGYMFGGEDAVASSSRANAVVNTTSNSVKQFLDLWYENNIIGTKYEEYLVDTLFCNDRRLQSEVGGIETGTGFGKSSTNYAGRQKIWTTKSPEFICFNKNDRFTVSDTATGNGALNYPVGLLTSYEANAAGVVSTQNYPKFLGTGEQWLTMTPGYFNQGMNLPFLISSSTTNSAGITNIWGVRGVINIKSDTLVTGNGSVTSPFKVHYLSEIQN